MKKSKFKNKLNGKRITLRRAKPSFRLASRLFALIEKNRARLLPWLQWVHKVKKPEDEYSALLEFDREWEKEDTAAYAICAGGKVIGMAGMHAIDLENESGEIGYWIDGDYEGRGLVGEAVRLLEDEFFGLGLHRIIILCDAENKNSARVSKRNGYKPEGTLKGRLLYKGATKHSDTLVFAKLKPEWEKGKRRR